MQQKQIQKTIIMSSIAFVALFLAQTFSELLFISIIMLCCFIAFSEIGTTLLQRIAKQEQQFLPRINHTNISDTLPDLYQKQSLYYFEQSMLDIVQKGALFIALGIDKTVFSISLKNAYHILISAKTGNGKTTLIKQLLLQMVQTCECYFVHPMFAEVGGVEDDRVIEVWTPISDRLAIHPRVFKGDYPAINALLLRFELALNQRAKEKGTPVERTWKKRYLFIDEGPAVVAQCPDAKRVIGRIVREGRQLGIFLALSTQGAQVQTLGISTANLAQFGTKFYLGGCDSRTRREVMPQLEAADEAKFEQKGTLCFTSIEQQTPQFVQLPLMRNETLFKCFGLTFDKNAYAEWFDIDVSSMKNSANGFQKHKEYYPETLELETPMYVDLDTAMNIAKACEELKEEGKQLTLHAIWKKTGLNWTDNERIYYVAEQTGFDIVKGKGGPRKKEQ